MIVPDISRNTVQKPLLLIKASKNNSSLIPTDAIMKEKILRYAGGIRKRWPV